MVEVRCRRDGPDIAFPAGRTRESRGGPDGPQAGTHIRLERIAQFPRNGMAVLVVRHVTTYRYKRPVRLGEHRLMFRPRDSFDQRLLHSHLAIVPQPSRLRWIHDVFGNCVTLFDFDTSSTLLEVASIIQLEHTPERAPDFQIEEYAKLHPFEYHPEQLPDLSSCIERQLPDPDREVITWLGRFLSPGRGSRPAAF